MEGNEGKDEVEETEGACGTGAVLHTRMTSLIHPGAVPSLPGTINLVDLTVMLFSKSMSQDKDRLRITKPNEIAAGCL